MFTATAICTALVSQLTTNCECFNKSGSSFSDVPAHFNGASASPWIASANVFSFGPPSKNLEVKTNDKCIFAKNSFDQWTLVYLVEQNYKDILKIIANINMNDEILASDYSYGQVYFEISGENKDEFLNKLTQFDLRDKKFPDFSMAQTLIARIDCYIYKLNEKYIITCNKSYEDYFKKRLIDLINL